jgi:dephospho-CoA kinase
MKLVGLGGGIGAGKSTVSAQLRDLGAVIVDADLVAREVVAPGTVGLKKIAERFGAELIDEVGALKRSALATIVFNDPVALADLNAITHPAIAAEMLAQIHAHTASDRVVIWDSALLFNPPSTSGAGVGAAATEGTRIAMVAKMVVDVDAEIAIARLQQFRGFSEADARARVANQMSRSERVTKADFVLDNSGNEEDLRAEVGRAWAWISTLPSN